MDKHGHPQPHAGHADRTNSSDARLNSDDGGGGKHVGSSSLSLPPSSSSTAAALEVLRLLGFVLDMVLRQKGSLEAMVSEGKLNVKVGGGADTTGDDENKKAQQVVERLEAELRGLRELWSSLPPSVSLTSKEEEVSGSCIKQSHDRYCFLLLKYL